MCVCVCMYVYMCVCVCVSNLDFSLLVLHRISLSIYLWVTRESRLVELTPLLGVSSFQQAYSILVAVFFCRTGNALLVRK